MKFIRIPAVLALFLVAGTAAATCNNGATNWPKCDNQPKPPTTTPTPTPSNSTWWDNANTNTSNNTNHNAANSNSNANANSNANSSSNSAGVGVGVGLGQGGAGGAGGSGGAGGAGGTGGVGLGGTGGAATGGAATGGAANQGQGQQQGIADSGNSTAKVGDIGLSNGSNSQSGSFSGGNSVTGGNNGGNTLTGGNTGGNSLAGGNNASESGVSGSGNGSASADNSGGNSAVSVDASDKSSINTSYRDETLFIPAVVPSSQSAVVGVGNVISVTGTCGPLQTVRRERIVGTYVGLIKRSTIEQGFNETLAPYTDAQGNVVSYRTEQQADGSAKFYGHQPVLLSTVVAIGASRNIALGGGSGRDWGQAGGGSSSSMTQLVTQVHLMPCEVQAQPRQVLVEVPVKTGRR